MYNCIIFDVDGTLLDTQEASFEAYRRVFRKLSNREFSAELFSTAYGIPTRQALENFGLGDIDEAYGIYLEAFSEFYGRVKPFEGVEDMLRQAAESGRITGIVTSRSRGETGKDPILRRLLRYFRFVVCAEDTLRHKPDPEPLLKFLEISGAETRNTLYLGDTAFDAACADGAGVSFALALWGAKKNHAIKADHYIEKPADLLKILD